MEGMEGERGKEEKARRREEEKESEVRKEN